MTLASFPTMKYIGGDVSSHSSSFDIYSTLSNQLRLSDAAITQRICFHISDTVASLRRDKRHYLQDILSTWPVVVPESSTKKFPGPLYAQTPELFRLRFCCRVPLHQW
jgi:hypothetical protein